MLRFVVPLLNQDMKASARCLDSTPASVDRPINGLS
jgi:hypothetical protein